MGVLGGGGVQIKAAIMIINDSEWVSTPGKRCRHGVKQT